MLGYKGTPDVRSLSQLSRPDPPWRHSVSVAGHPGGSPIADSLPAAADRWINSSLDKCKGDITRIQSDAMSAAFLSSYPPVCAHILHRGFIGKQQLRKHCCKRGNLRIFVQLTNAGQTRRHHRREKYLGAALASFQSVRCHSISPLRRLSGRTWGRDILRRAF